jgi:hypothetical protein
LKRKALGKEASFKEKRKLSCKPFLEKAGKKQFANAN